ncbi:hypothetical protein CDAR_90901 [Caerostris darwini]|uniref:Uncharacterized protein n=1 Tax=Caerostris darwini TaxID=1538125 RepID=A0AAV4QAA7_9ARAC|nr:hypothetical protein CDAR_90901 [Caerostris darwini]
MDYEATIEKIKGKINSLGKCPIHNCPAHYCNTDDNFSQKNQANSNPKKRYAEPTIKSSKMRINQDDSFQRPNKRHTARSTPAEKSFRLPTHNKFDNIPDEPAVGGTAIFVKRHLPYHHIPTPPLQHIEATVISLNLPNLDPIIIASIYVPVTSDPQLFTLDLVKDLQIDDGSFWNLTKNFKSSQTKISHLNSTTSTAIKDLDKAELIAQNLEKRFQLNPISDPVHENTVMQTINNFYQNNSDDIIPPASPSVLPSSSRTRKLNRHLDLIPSPTKF